MKTLQLTVFSVTIFFAILTVIVFGFSVDVEPEPQESSDSDTQYMNYESTCNNVFGQPDGECFVNSFEKCKIATIKNKTNSVEGDPVFFYAMIIPNDSCEIYYEIDDRLDKFGSGSYGEVKTCSDVKLNKNELNFLCGDAWHYFPLY